MADGKQQPVSFDAIIQEGRKKKQAEKLAQEIFGKGRRSSAPSAGPKPGLGGSLASRVGVTKRTPSLPRSATPRQGRAPPQLNRPSASINTRPQPAQTQSFSGPVRDVRRNGAVIDGTMNGDGGINFKGAASGPYYVVAQNFAPGTTASDIESVMIGVGGELRSCVLTASTPTVIAEMAFVDKTGAQKVIDTFNNKKADGRPLYVFWKSDGGRKATRAPSPPPAPAPAEPIVEDVAMDVDENAEAREAENRLREERRGRDDRDRREVFPSAPRNNRGAEMDYYDRPRRPEPSYQGGRYGGYGGDSRGGYYRDGGGRGRYQSYDSRRYGGQSWRP